MSRTSLPNRRQNITVKVTHQFTSGKEQNLLVTFGLNRKGDVKEAFCADFKEGNDVHTLIMDGCVVISLLLQHGYSATDIGSKMAPAPRSILKTIIDAAIELEKE